MSESWQKVADALANNWFTNNVVWRLVFRWKKLTGWLDLNRTITVTGEVLNTDLSMSGDGDVRFDLRLDPGQEWVLTGIGGRLTHANSTDEPALHCEIVPWKREVPTMRIWQELQPGDRVRVKGEWGFDGVHLNRGKAYDVMMALVRHQPNMHDGWFEIHPVEHIEKL